MHAVLWARRTAFVELLNALEAEIRRKRVTDVSRLKDCRMTSPKKWPLQQDWNDLSKGIGLTRQDIWDDTSKEIKEKSEGGRYKVG
jgi:hypothetical protein